MNVSVIVPVFNSVATLSILVKELESVLEQAADKFEVILVNDASVDESWSIVLDLMTKHSWVTGINFMRNYGQDNALLCGIRAVRYEIIVTLDDDLQHPPDQIPLLLNKLAEGYDVVYGAPLKLQHSIFRNLASQLTKMVLQNAMGGPEIATNLSAFRAFRSSVCGVFTNYTSPIVNIDVLLSWGTSRFAIARVRHEARPHGKSNYTFFRLVAHAYNLLTGFSVLPLRLATWNGFFMVLFGGLILVYVLAMYVIHGSPIPGFPFLASIISIFAGSQLLSLGIIGEYISRSYLTDLRKPTYVVRPLSDAEAYLLSASAPLKQK